VNIARLRLRSQRLLSEKFDHPADVVSWFGGVQAQDFPFARWGIGLRMNDPRDTKVRQAFDDGEIIRTHALRPTWHFVARDDFRWIMDLTSARVHAMNAGVYRQHELDDVAFRKTRKLIIKALEGGNYLTRTELAAALAAKGTPAAGQRMAYIAMRAELDSLICSGPLRGKNHTYALVDERIPPAVKLDPDESLMKLASRYFSSHGPATPHDFAWWSALTVAAARRGLEMLGKRVESFQLDGKTYWMSAGLEPAKFRSPVAHFLPNYDEHVVAYRDHNPSLDPRTPNALYGWGTGMTSHVVIRDGLVIGGWRRRIDGDRAIAPLNIPIKLNKQDTSAVKRAAAAYATFMQMPMEIEW
jgi:hypothetical protein